MIPRGDAMIRSRSITSFGLTHVLVFGTLMLLLFTPYPLYAGKADGLGGYEFKVDDQGGGGVSGQWSENTDGGTSVSIGHSASETPNPDIQSVRIEYLVLRWMNIFLVVFESSR